VIAILPSHLPGVDQAEIRFIEQRRRLKGVLGAFSAHVMASQAMQVAVNERCQCFECGLVAPTPGDEQLGYRSARFHLSLAGFYNVWTVVGQHSSG
jgi:hypothetical protein